MAAAALSSAPAPLRSLLCSSAAALSSRLAPFQRVAGLDITPTHLSVSVSDRSRRAAAPFGVLARSGTASEDARALARAISHAHAADPRGSLDLAGLVVGAPPGGRAEFDYVEALLAHGVGDDEVIRPFGDVGAVLFWSEAEALRRAATGIDDFVDAVHALPPRLETRKFGRFDRAMTPKLDPALLEKDLAARARISASELLQSVLDDMAAASSSET